MGEPLPNHVDERLHAIEEKLKDMEVHDTSGLDVIDMCLVPSLIIPKKCKVPDFKKYKGIGCPKTYLRVYF